MLVGHVTKDGSVAGPRVLEHLVDCVLQFEGDRYHAHRVLRAAKNRFGSTNELGVFEMTGAGLVGVPDPSEVFGRTVEGEPGAAVACALEGTRPILLEIQALVAKTDLAMPRRVATGVDPKRLAMIVAVLARHAGVPLGQADVFVNVAGGLRIDEPGADLAVALAIASAARRLPVRAGTAAFGEIGLTGRLRPAAQAERRLDECAKLGLDRAVAPSGTPAHGKMRVEGAETLRAALRAGLDATADGDGSERETREATRTERSLGDLGFTRAPSDDDPRRDPNLLEAIAKVAPGSELRQAVDDIIRSHEGALIVVGDPNELAFLYSGGIRLDAPFRPQLLYELAKMDGAIIVDQAVKRLAWANVQLMPDATIHSDETGTRHRTAERVAKQTGALVVSVSQQRETVTVFVGPARYQLDPVADVLAKTNQALGTLETYRQRLEQVLTRLTALEFQNAVVLDDVLVVMQRAEMTSRMADRITRDCIELGSEGRLIRLQLEELVGDVPAERDAIVRDYAASGAGRRGDRRARRAGRAELPGAARVRPPRPSLLGYDAGRRTPRPLGRSARLSHPLAHPAPSRGGRAPASSPTSASSTPSCAPRSASWRRSRVSAPSVPARSARGCGASRNTISSTATCSSEAAREAVREASFWVFQAVSARLARSGRCPWARRLSWRKSSFHALLSTLGRVRACTRSATRWCIRTTERERSSRRKRARSSGRSAST